MNHKKICFILCSNDEILAQECILYLEQLEVPAGFTTEIVVIKDAVSMAEGYNRAMKQTDAKYKVYLHQDVLMIEKNFLKYVLEIFQKDSQVGMLGVVGNRSLPKDGAPWSDGMYRRVGEVLADVIRMSFKSLFAKAEKPWEEVIVIDGLLMVTQYDIPWREDLFQGWDFYDCSQSLEFIKAGYQVVVPYMEHPWCFHDNDELDLDHYEKWREIFEKEYQHIYRHWKSTRQREHGNITKSVVIYQKFMTGDSLLDYPYPPLFSQENIEYLCFTDRCDVKSDYWKIIPIEHLEDIDHIVESHISEYEESYELKPNQIIVHGMAEEVEQCMIEIPSFEQIPEVEFDAGRITPTRDKDGNYIYRKNPIYTKGKYEGREYLLTIGMPVSNQIATIERCLKGVKPILDALDAELLVVDTGSTDGTIEICKQYGARVVEFPWCDNMSAARNMAVYNAKGAWYMSIDDDEWFEDVSDIIDFFKTKTYKKCQVATYVQRNYMYTSDHSYKDDHVRRIAKVTPDLHFEGRIHDCITMSGNLGVCQLSSVAHHYGFVRDNMERLIEKYKRNTAILLMDLYEFPEHMRYHFQLANEFRCVNFSMESIAYCCRGMAISLEKDDVFFGKLHAGCLLENLREINSDRLYQMTEMLVDRYPFSLAEKALYYFNMAESGFYQNLPLEKIISCCEKYIYYREEYQKSPLESQLNTFSGLYACDGGKFLADIHAIAFAAYCKYGDLEHAIKESDAIDLNEVYNHKDTFLSAWIEAEERVFYHVLERLTSIQCELWMEEYIRAYKFYIKKSEDMYVGLQRLLAYVNKLNIKNIDIMTDNLWTALGEKEKVIEILLRGEAKKNQIQENYFEALILKNILFHAAQDEKSMEIFFKYAEYMGSFVSSYYAPSLLKGECNGAIPGYELSAYYVNQAVIQTMEGNGEGIVRNLRLALKSFPGFKAEISNILKSITR